MNQSDIRMRQNLCRRLSAARRRQKYEPGLRHSFYNCHDDSITCCLHHDYTRYNLLTCLTMNLDHSIYPYIVELRFLIQNNQFALSRGCTNVKRCNPFKRLYKFGKTACKQGTRIDLTRLPSKQQLRWLWTRTPLAYRDSRVHKNLSCHDKIIAY